MTTTTRAKRKDVMIKDVMTTETLCLEASESIQKAASMMRDKDMGSVMVTKDGTLCGIVTDRDIVLRATADGRDPAATALGDICSEPLMAVAPDEPFDEAVRTMREHKIRRLPVTDDGKPMGFVSLGDLAEERDPGSALGEISAAPPNN